MLMHFYADLSFKIIDQTLNRLIQIFMNTH